MLLQSSGSVDPHIALCSCGPTVLPNFDGGFIGMDHVVPEKFLFEYMIQSGDVQVSALVDPVAHVLTGEEYIHPLEFLLCSVNRNSVYKLVIHDRSNYRRRGYTVPEQSGLLLRSLYDLVVGVPLYAMT